MPPLLKKAWLRIPLKILLVYFIACTPGMWTLAMLKPPLSIASILFILASSFSAPWAYLARMARGEMEYLRPFTPFMVLLVIGLMVVWWTESSQAAPDKRAP